MIRAFEPSDMNEIIALARENAKEANVDSILPIDDVYFTKTLKSLLVKHNNHCIVAEHNGKIVGYSLIGFITKVWNNTLYGDVYFFYVHESIRNKYFADALFDSTVDACKKAGCRWIEWSVNLFDDKFTGAESFVERASTYFEHRGGNHCGNMFVYDLEHN